MTTTDNNDKPMYSSVPKDESNDKTSESNDKLREPTKADPSAGGGGCVILAGILIWLIWLNGTCNDPRGINKARRDEAEFQRAFDRNDHDEMRRLMKRQAMEAQPEEKR